jgi:hypothetical protein
MIDTYQTYRSRRRASGRSRVAAVIATLAVAMSASVLSQFHAQNALNERLGEASSPLPSSPLTYFPR